MRDSDTLHTLPLQALHAGLGARFGEFAGWRMPLWYSGAVVEHNAVRQNAGIFDISHMGRYEVTGEDPAAVLSALFTRNFTRLEPGKSTYALACNEGGGILDDLMVYRLGGHRFVVICNAANRPVIGAALTDGVPAGSLTDLQADSVLLAVQGPRAVELVSEALTSEVLKVPRRGCDEAVIEGTAYFLARTGYTGEDGFEVMTSAEAGSILYQRLVDAGCTPAGLASRDTLRLEASLPLYGLDIDESTSPWEAGLGWAVDLDHDFTGRDALSSLKHAEERRLACMITDGPGVLRPHQPIYQGDEQVSDTSSGGFSPTLDRSIAMAYLPLALIEPGTRLEVDVRGRRVPCHVVARPFYRTNSRH